MTTEAAQTTPAKARRPAPIGLTVFLAFMILAATAWIGIAIASNTRAPGVVGFLSALFGGLFTFVLIVAIGGWVALKLSEPVVERKEDAAGGEAPADLAPILADLEASRRETVRLLKERAAWRAPLAMAAGLGAWTLVVLAGFGGGAWDFIFVLLLGALAGCGWAGWALVERYGAAYREKILPRMVATLGNLTFRRAGAPDLSVFRAERILPAEFKATTENEIAGEHRGLAVKMTEMKIKPAGGQGDDDGWSFNGLLVRIDLKRDVEGTTVAFADGRELGKLRVRAAANGRQRIEAPEFGRLEAWSDNAASARALLHPVLRERLGKLGDSARFGPPLVLAKGSAIWIAVPKRARRRSIFAAPVFTDARATREALASLRADIVGVLSVVDVAAP